TGSSHVDGAPDQLLVAPMDAVEHADGDHATAPVPWQIVQSSPTQHASRLSDRGRAGRVLPARLRGSQHDQVFGVLALVHRERKGSPVGVDDAVGARCARRGKPLPEAHGFGLSGIDAAYRESLAYRLVQ